MKYEILAELYHRFYVPQERSAEKTEIEACHAELSKTLDRSERRLLLKLLDVEDCIRDAGTLESFIAGFRVAWRLSAELNMDTNERPASGSEGSEEGARFTSGAAER